MIHLRFASAVLGLCVLAAIPTTVHTYLGMTLDDGRHVSAIDPTLVGMSSQTGDRSNRWARGVYGAFDWTERFYRRPDGGDLQLFVARSYDLKKLYHHPELGVANKGPYVSSLRSAGTTSLQADREIPVHVLRGTTDDGGLAVYALHYGDRFVSNPYLFQIRSSLTLLVTPRRPMTLFFAHDRFAEPATSVKESDASRLLVAAIESFLGAR